MDASAALDRLRDISSQVRAAVIFDRGGEIVGSTLSDDERTNHVAQEATHLLESAERRRQGDAGGGFAQLEVALREGSVFVVRHDDRLIAAVTSPEPTVGLVFYDLKSCLRDLEEPAAEPSEEPTAAATAEPEPPAKPTAEPEPTERKPRPRKKAATSRRKKTDAEP
jgi:predicted regulator of Ras-like GTPase activity (Roadblock/LC7/MglB family)